MALQFPALALPRLWQRKPANANDAPGGEPLDGRHGIVPVHDQRARHDVAPDRGLGQRGDDPAEFVGTRPAGLGAQRGTHPLPEAAQIGEHVDEEPPPRVVLFLAVRGRGRYLADVVEHDGGSQAVRQFERRCSMRPSSGWSRSRRPGLCGTIRLP